MNIFLQFANWLLKPLHEDSGMPDEDSSVPELTDVVGVGTPHKQENLLTLNKPVSQNIVTREEDVAEIPALASQPFQYWYRKSKDDPTIYYFSVWATSKATARKPAWTKFQQLKNAGETSANKFHPCDTYNPKLGGVPYSDTFVPLLGHDS